MTNPNRQHHIGRQWSARLHYSLAASMLMLLIGFTEPFACIGHCQAWLQLSARSTVVERHPQTHNLIHTGGLDERTQFRLLLTTSADDAPAGAPSGPASDPHHEHQAALVVFLFLALTFIVQGFPIPLPHAPPRRMLPPPLRPPIMNVR